jgi:hypothetical protein
MGKTAAAGIVWMQHQTVNITEQASEANSYSDSQEIP